MCNANTVEEIKMGLDTAVPTTAIASTISATSTTKVTVAVTAPEPTTTTMGAGSVMAHKSITLFLLFVSVLTTLAYC